MVIVHLHSSVHHGRSLLFIENIAHEASQDPLSAFHSQ